MRRKPPTLARSAPAVLGLLLSVATAHAAPAASAAAAAPLDAVVRKAHDAGQFDGVVLFGRDGDVLYRGAIGAADRIAQLPHAAGEVWRWASITKQVTAVLVMQEVEHGRLRLDGTLADYLPGFGDASIGRVTLQQLLQHTSGLANPDDTAADMKGVPSFYRGEGAPPLLKGVAKICAEPPKGAPGVRFEYNNCDYLVLGAILERLNALPYAQIVARRIAKPLGLRSLGVTGPSAGTARSSVAGYSSEGSREPALNIGRFGAAGALYGSADDLLRFDRALMDFKLVSRPSSTLMWRGERKLGYVALGAWSYPATLKHCTAPIDVVERQGEIGGIRAVNVIAPDRHAAFIAFSNTASTDWGQVWQGKGLLYDLLDAAFCQIPADVTRPAKPKRAAR